MPVIDLSFALDVMGLIVKGQSGVFYTRQSGGSKHYYPMYEGSFYPISDGQRIQKKLDAIFYGDDFSAGQSITADVAEKIQIILRNSSVGLANFIEIDFNKVPHSFESWLHVKLLDLPNKFHFFDWEINDTLTAQEKKKLREMEQIKDNYAILPQDQKYYGLFGFETNEAVLTWPNRYGE